MPVARRGRASTSGDRSGGVQSIDDVSHLVEGAATASRRMLRGSDPEHHTMAPIACGLRFVTAET